MDQNAAAGTLAGHVAVITGGSSGVGQYTALGLAQLGATVVITARDANRLAETASWLRLQVPGAKVETEQVDFTSLDSVRAIGGRIAQRHPCIAVLVNNAGLVMTRRTVTRDGFEAVLQINHLAPFLLTHLLLPAVKAAQAGRVVATASDAAKRATVDFDDIQMQKSWAATRVYGRSKLMNIMFTYALARRLEGTGVTANALHPGFVASRIGNKGGFADLIWALIKPFALTPAQGAETAIYLASAPEMAGITGQYFYRKALNPSNDFSHDVDAQERLWRVSAEMTGIEH